MVICNLAVSAWAVRSFASIRQALFSSVFFWFGYRLFPSFRSDVPQRQEYLAM